jgi:hypothetical protein
MGPGEVDPEQGARDQGSQDDQHDQAPRMWRTKKTVITAATIKVQVAMTRHREKPPVPHPI